MIYCYLFEPDLGTVVCMESPSHSEFSFTFDST